MTSNNQIQANNIIEDLKTYLAATENYTYPWTSAGGVETTENYQFYTGFGQTSSIGFMSFFWNNTNNLDVLSGIQNREERTENIRIFFSENKSANEADDTVLQTEVINIANTILSDLKNWKDTGGPIACYVTKMVVTDSGTARIQGGSDESGEPFPRILILNELIRPVASGYIDLEFTLNF